MPLGTEACLLRRVKCVRGSVSLSLECTPAFDYGRQKHIAERAGEGVVFRTEKLTMALSTDLSVRIDQNGGVRAEFVLNEGQSRTFVFKQLRTHSCESPPSEREAQELFSFGLASPTRRRIS